jgi:hypothetical protein
MQTHPAEIIKASNSIESLMVIVTSWITESKSTLKDTSVTVNRA